LISLAFRVVFLAGDLVVFFLVDFLVDAALVVFFLPLPLADVVVFFVPFFVVVPFFPVAAFAFSAWISFFSLVTIVFSALSCWVRFLIFCCLRFNAAMSWFKDCAGIETLLSKYLVLMSVILLYIIGHSM
jgi:hypothetical protein